MSILLVAIVFYFTAVRQTAARETATKRNGSLVACLSLALWALVPAGGIFIGYVG
jgi:hypothetical protein